MLGKMTALEAVFHPGFYGSGIALGDPEVLEHSGFRMLLTTVKLFAPRLTWLRASK
jgi:hypothetical protein